VAVRLALVFECVAWAAADVDGDDHGPLKISEASVLAGIALAEWFIYETARVYADLAENQDDRAVRELLQIIRAHGGEITPRDLANSNRRYRPVSVATEALDGFVKDGIGEWICPKPGPSGGQPRKVLRLKSVSRAFDTPAEGPESKVT